MKNLKKFNRANLKEVFGGVVIPHCPINYSYLIPTMAIMHVAVFLQTIHARECAWCMLICVLFR
ncbi:hypothetical protein SAMN05444360_101362 [Chryseobacterium carnipullorum]|uniref:bacteriocin-like protein n=1 Tax=Chryseobacterium carnipullorum TaxID=1124835 RepID=UPI00091038C3|nr:hypothetical protein [Chryseobacterium carnipullorum]SHL38953.1 hypothetical protein SAMN05444360_101362 [Chryseobacterium carnipullorum]